MECYYLAFVRIEDEGRFERVGWRRAKPCGGLLGTPHGQWAVIMEWHGEGEPPMPSGRGIDDSAGGAGFYGIDDGAGGTGF
jgi:hypothetical protein